ncbi:TRAFAC clade GTPase domain-containing protein [Streptomyces griseoincarnatus]|uniref:TRAFAC clade GTPase domain-containing protein n=1 Tax=Streptomyces TaxID=1883 RepID=UPI001C1E7683|nr:hypothetical protein [Streptomyces sp. PAM3C]MBU5946607.1 hypothetical protein [Streptomyces sp. PAM3C]
MTVPMGPDATIQDILCPYCLEIISYDEQRLFVRDDKQMFEELRVDRRISPLRLADTLRSAYQRCGSSEDGQAHYIPVPYLTNGAPLTVAMVGDSATGKTHLLTQMIAEIADGGLKRYGLQMQSVNPQDHQTFMSERVERLRSGEMLEHTRSAGEFAAFVDALLLSRHDGTARPVAFFDLAGEDLRRTDALTRFMVGVDALIFVVDPLRALPMPYLDPLRGDLGHTRGGDPAFQTVLDRLPRTSGQYLGVAAAVVINKSDLVRFEPPVDRWLAEPPPDARLAERFAEESRDAYAFLRHHTGQAWAAPFDSVLRCTLHFASATGSHDHEGRFPHGTRPLRVLEPLVSVLSMCGLVDDSAADGATVVGW